MYDPQTKILDGRTNVSECFFVALFKCVRTRFGLQIVEKRVEKSVLNGVCGLPKFSFGEHITQPGFEVDSLDEIVEMEIV
jgi:hypothetical protein